MVIDHVGLRVSEIKRSRHFYSKSLETLGITLIAEDGENVGFGKGDKAPFWFGPNKDYSKKIHIAFQAENRAQVDAFYKG